MESAKVGRGRERKEKSKGEVEGELPPSIMGIKFTSVQFPQDCKNLFPKIFHGTFAPTFEWCRRRCPDVSSCLRCTKSVLRLHRVLRDREKEFPAANVTEKLFNN